jgi:hypothetical protein
LVLLGTGRRGRLRSQYRGAWFSVHEEFSITPYSYGKQIPPY